jgi:hypothetical protein
MMRAMSEPGHVPPAKQRSPGASLRHSSQAIGLAAVLTLIVLTLPACGTGSPAVQHAVATPVASSPTMTPGPTAPSTKTRPQPKVIVSRFRAADGSLVTLALFRGPVIYRLHSGSIDPGAAALSLVRAGPGISGWERRRLLAAFNGGFLLSTGAGGYEQEGHVLTTLRPGLASLVIDTSGVAHIGVWGRGLPRPHEAVFSVRQNLGPLVRYGHATSAAADWTVWGATLGGGEQVARSAIGENAAGELIYAASMSTSPADLAAALVHAGARTAMELDINPEWVQLDVARALGRRLWAAIPGQVRPADQYLLGWTRDFFTVLAAG